MSLILILIYGFAVWFGSFLLTRASHTTGMSAAGLGLLSYAGGIGVTLVINTAPDLGGALALPRSLFTGLPAVFWLVASLSLLPRVPIWVQRALPLLILVMAVLNVRSTPLLPAFFALVGVVIVGDLLRRRALPPRPLSLLFTGALFFFLSTTLAVLPAVALANEIVALLIGIDLALLGVAIAALDAYEQGEALRVQFLRSLLAALLLIAAFGGQVVAAMAITGARSLALTSLLLAVVTTAAVLPLIAPWINRAFDRLILARRPQQRDEIALLRETADAAQRRDETLDLLRLDDAEFARLTRRALSSLRDPAKLAASPLLKLPQIDQQLGSSAGTLERAAALRTLLAESITRLKPHHAEGFGTSDAWRHYNALYFPYVVGLKPHSLRAEYDALEADAQAALIWFRAYVPERTLHNWQNAAAKLIAQDLREGIEQLSQRTL